MAQQEYYQVPNKPIGEFNITNDRVYTLTPDPNGAADDTNFGKLALCSEVPVAGESTVGGMRLWPANGGSGTINSDGKRYSVQLTEDNQGYVYVPWINTLYQTEDDQTGEYTKHPNCLCMRWDQTPTTIPDGDNGTITTDGGLMKIGLSVVPVDLLSGGGNMISGPYSSFEYVKDEITNPLSNEISSAEGRLNEALELHNTKNEEDFNNVHLSIDGLSNYLHDNFYLCTLTSNDVEINNALVSLSNDFESYLRNTLLPGIRTNPAYLSNEVDAISAALSAEVVNSYWQKLSVYTKDDTYSRDETYNRDYLNAKFDTKQDNLKINEDIDVTKTYGSKDVATVSAIVDYVKTNIEKSTATFQGHFSSWQAVPFDGEAYDPKGITGYILPVPDKNDYIYVDLSDNNELKLNAGTWKFTMSSDKTDEHGQMKWNPDLGRDNWKPEYRITDTIFTDALTRAINSGITDSLVSIFKDANSKLNKLREEYDSLYSRLRALAFQDNIPDNITGVGQAGQIAMFNGSNSINGIDFMPKKEKWIFELQDGDTKVSKYMLVQDI